MAKKKQKRVVRSTRTIKWKCVESRIESKCLNYGRFIVYPLKKGQANTIGIAMRRALLGEIKGTSITRARFEKVSHEYSRIIGIEETIHEILENLKQIVFRSFTNEVIKAFICVSGPTHVSAKDIQVPPSVEIIDTTQYIATLTEGIDLSIELQIETDRGYRVKHTKNFQDQDGSYPIDAVSMPVRAVNYTIHNRIKEGEEEEMLFLEIWTNGSLTPKEALRDASMNLIELFNLFLHPEEPFEEGGINLKEKKNTPDLAFKDEASYFRDKSLEELEELKKYVHKKQEEFAEIRLKKPIAWNFLLDSIFLDQVVLLRGTYYSLRELNLNTILDILNTLGTNHETFFYLREEESLDLSFGIARVFGLLAFFYKKLDPTNYEFIELEDLPYSSILLSIHIRNQIGNRKR